MRKCVLFCRVSSREQEETGYSLPAQEKFLREYARRSGFRVAKVFSVSESASGRVSRKIFNEMLSYIKKHSISVLIVETTDRLTRNFADVPTIDSWVFDGEDNQIHLVKEGCVLERDSRSHEWFMWRVKVATAEYYIRLLSENVRKAQKEKLSQGWLPTTPPLGYETVGRARHKVHVIDEEKGQLIKRMFELYGSGLYSLKAISEKMRQEGLRTRAGKRLSVSHTHRLLTDPFFVGKVRWKGETYDGSQESLVSMELFDRVQKILNSKTAPYYRRHNYLFRGIFKCSHCGRSISWERHKGHVYGHCHFPSCPQKKWYKEPEVESHLLDIFGRLEIKNRKLMGYIRKILKGSHQDEIIYRESALSELKQQHERLQKRLDKLYDHRLDDEISKETYDRKFSQYTAEKEKVEEKMKTYSQADTRYLELGMCLYDLSQDARRIYQKASVDRKRTLLTLVFEELSIDDGEVAYRLTKPVEALASMIKATNSSKVANSPQLPSATFEPLKKGLTVRKNRAFCPVHPRKLPCWDRFRTFEWVKCVQNPKTMLKQAKELLSLIRPEENPAAAA